MLDKQNIGHLFDRIARHYDVLNHILSLNIDTYWRRQAVKEMGVHGEVLDVAIGTGDLAIELIRRKKAHHVTGIDLSEEMICIGERKAAERGMTNQICFSQASALAIPMDEGTYDAVTCAYGVRNFSDLDEGLREMYRVMKPGGELMILEFSYPTHCIVRRMYDFYFSRILPLIGLLVSHDEQAYRYLNQSVKQFIWGEEMCDHLRRVGFRNPHYQTLTFGITTIYRANK